MWDKDNRPTYIRRGIFVLLIILTAMVQNTRGGFPSFFGTHAILTVPLVVVIAMFERGIAGMGFGLFAGLLLESCATNGDGFYAVFLMTAGFLCGTMITYYMRNNIVTALVLSGCACVLCSTLYWLFFVAARSIDGAALLYVRHYLLSALYTTVFTPVYYFIVMKLSEKIKKERRTFSF